MSMMMDYEFHDYDDEYTPLEDSGDRRRLKKKKKKQLTMSRKSMRLPPASDTTYRGGNHFDQEKRRSCLCRVCCFLCNCWTVVIVLSTMWATWLTLWLVSTYLLGPSGDSSPTPGGGTHVNAHGDMNADLVRIPYETASAKGALCLDGSAPAFYHRPGHDEGNVSWIVHLPDGQWCYNATNCFQRSRTSLGSSSHLPPSIALQGILSDDPDINPDFHHWHAVQLHYCDGASFTGNSPTALSVLDDGVIYQRGRLILDTIIAHLLNATGMNTARRIILSGTGSGGLGVFMLADHVKSLLPNTTTIHALADSAFYPDAFNRTNFMHIRLQFQRLFNLHRLTEGLDSSCFKSKLVSDPGSTWQCMFPEYGARFVSVPLFIANSMYEPWSLWFILNMRCHPASCPDIAPQMVQYGEDFVGLLRQHAGLSSEDGVFVTSCYEGDLIGQGWGNVVVGGNSLREAFASWYFNRTDPALADPRSALDVNATSVTNTTTTSSWTGIHWSVDCMGNYRCNKHCDWSEKHYELIADRLKAMDDFFIHPPSGARTKKRRAPYKSRKQN
ncbi:uncharacterized protein [Diadema setosum]|uniref:uncharacterized protein n=1 Tax=Diadema setosum TaxID=31175 RepID=UPI003B3B57E1